MRVRSQVLVGVALLLGFSLGNPASAASTYEFVDIDPVFQWATQGSPVSGTLDITTDDGDCFLAYCDTGGFDVGTDSVNDATLTFLLFDIQCGDDDIATIYLGDSSDPFQQAVVDGSDRFLFVLYLENIEAQVEVRAQINATGTIGWQVAAADGNRALLVKAAALQAGSENAIPEPSAALLFCLGFGVVGTATRKHQMH